MLARPLSFHKARGGSVAGLKGFGSSRDVF